MILKQNRLKDVRKKTNKSLLLQAEFNCGITVTPEKAFTSMS